VPGKSDPALGTSNMDGKPVVIISTASPDVAGTIARKLVERRLAACVNMADIRSCYRWKGEFCEDEEEVLLIAKTVEEKAAEVMETIRSINTYDLPEILVIPVISGYEPYLQWMKEEIET
jgi:periplasmic divalent cation tolerance protein